MESSMVRLVRKSSIDREPRTLHINQLDFAREAAMHVVNTRTIEEASRVFTEGLEAVVSCGRYKEDKRMDSGMDDQLDSSANIRRISGLRDVATAPF